MRPTAATASPGLAVAPPPWRLAGRGAVVLLRGAGRGRAPRLSALAFVEYTRSDVGPYLELLHVPRLTHRAGRVGPTIDRIWVTSPASVVSGRANWSLPKQLASVTRDATASGGAERWRADADGALLAELQVSTAGPSIPVYKPRWAGRLLQRMNGVPAATPIAARGTIRPARLTALQLGECFGDLGPVTPQAAFLIPSFQMRFLAAERR